MIAKYFSSIFKAGDWKLCTHYNYTTVLTFDSNKFGLEQYFSMGSKTADRILIINIISTTKIVNSLVKLFQFNIITIICLGI